MIPSLFKSWLLNCEDVCCNLFSVYTLYMFICRREDSPPFLDRATKYNPMFESDLTTGYSHYYQRYSEPPVHSSASAEASTEFSSEEIWHIYENSELTKEVWIRACLCLQQITLYTPFRVSKLNFV